MNKIGVFDSGIGGITVLKDLIGYFPGIDMVYLGDSARLPYGTKSSNTIIKYSLQCARFLISEGIDMLIVACNTASAYSIDALKEEFNIPVVGVIEAGSRAAVSSGAERIGVIGTSSTIRSDIYTKTIKLLKPEAQVFSQACPLFVPLVEEGWFEDDVTEIVARRYLAQFKGHHIDALLLGCTHYPLIKNVIRRVVGTGVKIIDSALTTAQTVKEQYGTHFTPVKNSSVVFYLSDINPRFIELGKIFLGNEMNFVYEVDLGI